MRQIIIIETAKELIEFANPDRAEGDTRPFLSEGKLVFEDNMLYVRLLSNDFQLADSVTTEDIIRALTEHANLSAVF